ncbi:hypothetical protein IB235_00055 [Paracoccus sp. PAR01]|nr:hypothetical protein [Paracoccus sp. PAR01]
MNFTPRVFISMRRQEANSAILPFRKIQTPVTQKGSDNGADRYKLGLNMMEGFPLTPATLVIPRAPTQLEMKEA